MHFSNRDLLMALYCGMTVLGFVLIGFSWWAWQQAETTLEPLSFWLAAIVLFIVGIAMIMFGIETYIERDDPDVWLSALFIRKINLLIVTEARKSNLH